MSWREPRVPDHVQLHSSLNERLRLLELQLDRLSASPEHAVSTRELEVARSHTAMSSRLCARMHDHHLQQHHHNLHHNLHPHHHHHHHHHHHRPPPLELAAAAAHAVFEQPELLENILGFLAEPRELASVGGVCCSWYLASRMQWLWEIQLRRSGMLFGPERQAKMTLAKRHLQNDTCKRHLQTTLANVTCKRHLQTTLANDTCPKAPRAPP